MNSRGLLFWSCLGLSLFIGAEGRAQEALPLKPAIPKDNPMTPEKVELGKQLFFDPRLSKDASVSCNSCHNVMGSGEDNRPGSVGIKGQVGQRTAPTVWNAAFQSVQFWDGRAASLEEQAKGPLVNPAEMGMENHLAVIERVKQIGGYVVEFKKVFGGKDPVTIDNLAKAIAAYERSLITPNSAFDRYIKGEVRALTTAQINGYETFKSTGCVACHTGPNFSGPALPVGVGFYHKFPVVPDSELDKKYRFTKDLGRYAVTKKESDKNTYRVPTLRNIALTAPYFHNGAVTTLAEAVRVMGKLQLGKDLSTEEIASIVIFLNSLTGEFPRQMAPQLPPTPNETVIQ